MGAIITALLIPLAGTVLGSAFVFFMKKEMPSYLQKVVLGFASGVMVAASVWSLLIPSMEMCRDMGGWAAMPATVGLLAGFAFLLLIDYMLVCPLLIVVLEQRALMPSCLVVSVLPLIKLQ